MGERNPKATLLAKSLIVLGLALSLGIKATRAQDRGADGTVTKLGALKLGAPAPNFELTSLKAGKLSLESLRGHALLLEFGATWCGPCRGLLSPLKSLAHEAPKFSGKVLSVDVGEDEAAVRRHYARRDPGELEVAFDPDSTAASAFGVRAFPTLVVLDPSGIVRFIHVGAPSEPGLLEEKLREAARP